MNLNNDRAAWLRGPGGHCEVPPTSVVTPWRLVLLGAPGVGKGTQAELLHGCLRACHLSTGDIFRAVTMGSGCVPSKSMMEAQEHMRRGALVPDSTVWGMVRERKGCLHCGGGFILDGFPRTLAQAKSLKNLMDAEGLDLTAVLNYELPIEEIVVRLAGRRTCAKCKAVFHLTERPPRVANSCDHCGGSLFQREDDHPESIKVRMEAYDRSTAPLIEFYQVLGLLVRVSASGSPHDIFQITLTDLAAKRVEQLAGPSAA
jgi:adenylate kinase